LEESPELVDKVPFKNERLVVVGAFYGGPL
jgi:hypothetical protein